MVVFKWIELVNEAMMKVGLNLRVAPSFKEMLIEAGFVDVTETKIEYPWGPWPEDRRMKAIGYWHVGMSSLSILSDCRANTSPEQLKQGLHGIVMKLFVRVLGWTPSDVEAFLITLQEQLDDVAYQLLDEA